MNKYLFILLLFCAFNVDAQRTSLKTGLQKSSSPFMIPVTDSNNEQVYRGKVYIDSMLQIISVSDTSAMLSHYIERQDTASMLLHFVERSDTATMLLKYALLSGRSGGQTLSGGTGVNDDLNFKPTTATASSTSYINFATGINGATQSMRILNTGVIGLGSITSPVTSALEMAGSTTNSSLKVGSFEFQGYAVNNCWLSDNVYYNGSNFVARANGFGAMNYFYNGAWHVRVAASSLTAGNTFTPKIPFVVNRNTSIAIGGDITLGTGLVGSRMMVDSIGKIGVNTSVADKQFEINLGTAEAFRLTYNDNNGSAANYLDVTMGSTGSPTFNATGTSPVFNFSDPIVAGAAIRLKSYTVATLPTGTQGDMAYVTDATAPTYLGALTGGGAVVCPVFYNGSAWVSH